jgi:hypothetical protein
MLLQNIYDTALKLLGEVECTASEAELAERAPYIGAALCTEASTLDRAYRRAFGMENAPKVNDLYIDLDSEFPLADRFAPAAAYYMAAMLILDEDVELYEKLFDRWCSDLAAISAEIPFVKGSTADVYPE